jgi:hypothetical protein
MLVSREPGIIKSKLTLAPSRILQLLTITVLHRIRRLDTLTGVLQLPRSNNIGKDLSGTGILTCFPFDNFD